jgi:tRNA G18 (ribose-2'-O)-methylase SpoU
MKDLLILANVAACPRADEAKIQRISDLLDTARRRQIPIVWSGDGGFGHISNRTNEPVVTAAQLPAVQEGYETDEVFSVGVISSEGLGQAVTDAAWEAPVGTSTEAVLGRWTTENEVREVGVAPHPQPWPSDAHLDPDLLASGDRRNVIDQYRYWRHDAIVADLDKRRHGFHVAIENWQHDFNIGTMVRNANAFLAAEVHIVGKKKWNRRGAMVTDKYQHIRHHRDFDGFTVWAAQEDLRIIGIDILPQSTPIETAVLPERCILLFGQEGPGLTEAAQAACESVLSIAQFGSTRSVNAGVASGIAMHAWVQQHAH